MAFLTPPFGYSLFYLRGISPPEMTIGKIYKGVVPFICLQWTGLILCILVPDVVLWIPRAFFGAGVIG
jgi:TRAP-type mannitol/chloroaromatic compound transport system permease large subunit